MFRSVSDPKLPLGVSVGVNGVCVIDWRPVHGGFSAFTQSELETPPTYGANALMASVNCLTQTCWTLHYSLKKIIICIRKYVNKVFCLF